MKRKEVQQQKTIIAATPEEFDQQVNSFLATLLDDTRKHPALDRSRTPDGGFQAIIDYWREVQEAETIRDEFVLRGERYRCDDCPHLRREKDRRIKWLTCEKGMKSATQAGDEVCDWFYEQLQKARKEMER